MTDFLRHLVVLPTGEAVTQDNCWAITRQERFRVWYCGRLVAEGFASMNDARTWCKANWRRIEKEREDGT